MAELPKLKVKGFRSDVPEEIRDFEQARYFPFSLDGLVIAVEGNVVRDYEDIVQLAAQQHNKGKEFLEVMFLPIIEGG